MSRRAAILLALLAGAASIGAALAQAPDTERPATEPRETEPTKAEPAETAPPAIEGKARASLVGDGPFWVGQAVTVRIDVLSTGFAFSDLRIDSPEIPGAIVLPPGSSSQKGTERIDGETWQVLGYRLRVYPQSAGRLEVPAIPVAFGVSAGYGSKPVQLALTTEPLALPIEAPPGLDSDLPLVTTRALKLTQHWEPEGETLLVGDALTREVRVQAEDVPGMLLPPTPAVEVPGLASYPADPEVEDAENRGSISGSRTDRFTLVFQRPGRYQIPGGAFQWWNPETRTLKTLEIGGLSVEVAPNPALEPPPPHLMERIARSPGTTLALLLSGALVIGLAVRISPGAMRQLHGWRRRRLDSEPARFRRLLGACRSSHPKAADRGFRDWRRGWLAAHRSARDAGADTGADAGTDPGTDPGTNSAIAHELSGLQRRIGGYETDWDGAPLGRMLEEWRNEQLAAVHARPRALRPLNPGPAETV
jgi:hypothetical protein